jgi:hypothetical protein
VNGGSKSLPQMGARARGAVFESQVGLAHQLMKQCDTAFCGVDMCIGDIQVL